MASRGKQPEIQEIEEPDDSSSLDVLQGSLTKIQDVYVKLVTGHPHPQIELCHEVGRTLRCIVRNYRQALSDMTLGEDSDFEEDEEEEDED